MASQVPADSPETARFLACHTLPLGLKKDARDKPWEVIHRATFSLLEVGGKHFFVTCAHVLEKFQEMQSSYPNPQLTAYTTIPKFTELFGFRLVDVERKILDVAVFCGQEDTVDLPARSFIPYKGSYLDDPAIGEPVCIVGYPSENIEVSDRRADLNYMQIIFRASSISDRQIVLADERGDESFATFLNPIRLRSGLAA
jgi:hypothetical protein